MSITKEVSSISKDRSGNREVAAIRAHVPGEDVDRLYRWLLSSFDTDDIYIVVDQTGGKKQPWSKDYNIIAFDELVLDQLGLYIPKGKVGWQCGDYFYIVLSHFVSFDFAWLIEPDVVANFPFSTIRNTGANKDFDVISSMLRKRDSTWNWYESMKRHGYEDIYSVFYPLTRLSQRLVSLIHQERKNMAARVNQGLLGVFPNDEAVTATVAIANDLSRLNLKELFPDIFTHFLWGSKWLYPDVLDRFNSEKIVHPALSRTQFAGYLKKSISSQNSKIDISSLGASLWSVSPENYAFWHDFVMNELSFKIKSSSIR